MSILSQPQCHPLLGYYSLSFLAKSGGKRGFREGKRKGLDHYISEGGARGFSKEGEAGLDSGDVLSGLVS